MNKPRPIFLLRQYLWHGCARLFLVASVAFPMYGEYLWLWVKSQYFKREIPREKWKAVHKKNARKFYDLAVRMKGGLIKVGQLISARVDVMPRVWTKTLAGLQDKVAPTPWAGIEKRLTSEYGRPPEEVFKWIEHDAVAAASFGQVHKAMTKDGTLVALKIKYPDIDLKLKVDMFLFGTAVRLFNFFVPKTDLRVIYREISQALRTELNYEQEAAYTRSIYDNMKGFPQIVIPRVLDEYTTRNVICTEFFEGYKITDFKTMGELGIERREVLEIILNAWTKMMYEDGVFQSDPHPGNLFFRKVNGAPEVCVVDFGQVKIMPKEFHGKLLGTVFSFLSRDVDRFLPSLVTLGILTEEDTVHVRPMFKEFFEKYFELSPVEARKLDFTQIREDVLETLENIKGITIPNDIILYGRTFSLLSGLAVQIDKTANMFLLAKPFILKTLASMPAPGAGPARPAAEAS